MITIIITATTTPIDPYGCVDLTGWPAVAVHPPIVCCFYCYRYHYCYQRHCYIIFIVAVILCCCYMMMMTCCRITEAYDEHQKLVKDMNSDKRKRVPDGGWVLLVLSSSGLVCWLLACLTSLQQASVSQGQICSDNFTCCHSATEVADQTFHLIHSQYADTALTYKSRHLAG